MLLITHLTVLEVSLKNGMTIKFSRDESDGDYSSMLYNLDVTDASGEQLLFDDCPCNFGILDEWDELELVHQIFNDDERILNFDTISQTANVADLIEEFKNFFGSFEDIDYDDFDEEETEFLDMFEDCFSSFSFVSSVSPC